MSGNRCVIRSDVLQHHDASAVVPLYADPTWSMDQIHATCVFHIQRVAGEWQFRGSVIYRDLKICKYPIIHMGYVNFLGSKLG